MTISHYNGFDVHKKGISYCVKTADGTITEEGNYGSRQAPFRGKSRGVQRAVFFPFGKAYSWMFHVTRPAVTLRVASHAY